jgi:hypothetical protein
VDEVRLEIAADIPKPEVEIAAQETDVTPETNIANLDPLTAAVIVGAALAAGKFLIRLWREIQGGTVIDVRQTPIKVDRSRALDYGFFMIVAKDGSVTIESKDEPKDSLERMVESVLKLPIDATVSAVKAALGQSSSGKAKVT